jgi:hypothetical protein
MGLGLELDVACMGLVDLLIQKNTVLPYFAKLNSVERESFLIVIVIELLLRGLSERTDDRKLLEKAVNGVKEKSIRANMLFNLGFVPEGFAAAVKLKDQRLLRSTGIHKWAADHGNQELETKCEKYS